jgi:DNA-binding CsgD family transcriptional regulator
MRMGIHNNETIAKALGYSVNTIYTYKTKVRNKSSLSTEDFDLAIRNISSVKK